MFHSYSALKSVFFVKILYKTSKQKKSPILLIIFILVLIVKKICLFSFNVFLKSIKINESDLYYQVRQQILVNLSQMNSRFLNVIINLTTYYQLI